MLKLFRINDPYRILVVLLFLVCIRVGWVIVGMPLSVNLLKWLVLGERLGDGFIMYSQAFDYTAPLSALVYKWIDFVFGATKWTHVVFSSLLIVIQSWIFNSTLLKNKAYEENTYIPAYLYMILASGVPDFWALTPELMSTTFILLAINQIFRRIDNVVTDELFLYNGIYVGIATFFYIPAAIFFIVFLISFIGFSSAVARRILLYIYGFSVVFLINWAYFFWYDAAGDFISSSLDFFRPKIFQIDYVEFLMGGAAVGVALVLSLFALFINRFTNFQQKTIQVMMLILGGSIVCLFLANDLSGTELILFVPTIAFLLTHYFLNIKKLWVKLLIPNLLIIGILVYPYFFIEKLTDEKLIAPVSHTQYMDKEIMQIGEGLSLYENNFVASPFIDNYISMKMLDGLNYYDKATSLYTILRASDPEIIIDRLDVMPLINERFPYFRKNYRKNSLGDYVKINN